MIELFETLQPRMEGRPLGAWVDAQRVFDCRSLAGKKTWPLDYTPQRALDESQLRVLHTLETFSGGSEWYQYVSDCPLVPGGGGPYLYHRQQDRPLEVSLRQVWDGQEVAAGKLATHVPASQQDYRARGCNDVVGAFGGAELHLLAPGAGCDEYFWPEPLCLAKPPWGLYELHVTWENPEYGAPQGPPAYPMPYDAGQRHVRDVFPLLAGQPPGDFDRGRHLLVGGVAGGADGTLAITHSARPGRLVVPVVRGAFYAAPPLCEGPKDDGRCWVRAYAPWSADLVSVPGVLRFTFEPQEGHGRIDEERSIVFGARGRHVFLLGAKPAS